MIEKTLVLLKHDTVTRGLVGEIITRVEKAGLKIIAMKMILANRELAEQHYPVTEEWYKKVGKNTLDDSKKYGISAKEAIGTEEPLEIGKKVHVWNVDYLTSGPVIAIVLEGIHAIETIRKLAGETVPNKALPGTIRGDFATTSALHSNSENRAIYNLVHSSGNKEEAEHEINLWFTKEELHSYTHSHDSFTK